MHFDVGLDASLQSRANCYGSDFVHLLSFSRLGEEYLIFLRLRFWILVQGLVLHSGEKIIDFCCNSLIVDAISIS